MTENNEVVFTYETLYELLRRERDKEELQEINEKFYEEALSYLKEKQELYDETLKKDDLFSISERDALNKQLNNIRDLLKKFYDKRERKIIDMALNAVKINRKVIDTEPLLEPEKAMYEDLLKSLEHYRKNVLLNILMLRKPNVNISTIKETKIGTEDKKNEDETKEIKKVETKEEKKIKTLKLKEDIEQFVGKNLEIYGPFKKEQEIKLPTEVANILIKQEKAEEI